MGTVTVAESRAIDPGTPVKHKAYVQSCLFPRLQVLQAARDGLVTVTLRSRNVVLTIHALLTLLLQQHNAHVGRTDFAAQDALGP
jgi:hypothetical protein